MQNPREFSPALHGLRGLAALCVLVAHLGDRNLPLIPVAHSMIGSIGVLTFFTLSAFLLTRRLTDELESFPAPAAVARYVIRRFFRIYPLFATILVVHWMVGDFPLASIPRHLVLAEGWRELWAIPVEEKFYLVLPLLILGTQTMDRKIALGAVLSLGVGSIVLGWIDPRLMTTENISLPAKFAPFALGIALALWKPGAMRTSAATFALWCVLVLSTCALRQVTITDISTAPKFYALIGLLAALTIAWSTGDGPLSDFLSLKPLVWLGEVSFSLYLTHYMVIDASALLVKMPAYSQAWLTFVLCLPIAAMFHRYVEAPGMALGRVLSARLATAPAPIMETRYAA